MTVKVMYPATVRRYPDGLHIDVDFRDFVIGEKIERVDEIEDALRRLAQTVGRRYEDYFVCGELGENLVKTWMRAKGNLNPGIGSL